MALAASESLRKLTFLDPAQANLTERITQHLNRLMRLHEATRIAPDGGVAPTGGYIDGGVGRSVDLQG
jgi:hypothetical protein